MSSHKDPKERTTERFSQAVDSVGDDEVGEGGDDDAKNQVLAWCGLGGDEVMVVETRGTPVKCSCFSLLLLRHFNCCLVGRHDGVWLCVEVKTSFSLVYSVRQAGWW